MYAIIKKLKQRGDTIVEVMICMVLVSGALTTSYGIARRSLSQIRDAQERNEMLKIGEAQIENIKRFVATNGYGTIISLSLPSFCISNSGGFQPAAPTPAQISEIKDVRCAVNEKGEFYRDSPTPDLNLSSEEVDGLGYPYRVGAVYHRYHNGYPIGGIPSGDYELNDFYIFAGRSTASTATANDKNNSVVTLFYRQHP